MHGLSDRRLSLDARAHAVAVPDQTQVQQEQRAVTVLARTAVFSMTFGPGAAVATYTTLFGWYQQTYDSRELLVWMRIALFAPFPIMKMLQLRYDTYFDEIYSTRAAYLFRIVFMQLVMASLMGVWMSLPTAVSGNSEVVPIVAFGVVLGACAAPFIGSSVQVAVAIDPMLLIWAQLGNTVGMSIPVIAEYAMKFTPNSTHIDMCKVIAIPMIISILSAMWLFALHRADVFTGAYQVIGERRRSFQAQSSTSVAESSANLANPQDDEDSDSTSDLSDSRDAALDGTLPSENAGSSMDEHGFPFWVWCWFGMQSLAIGLDFFLLALIGYFGDPSTTHHLAACTLLSATAGKFLTLPFRNLPGFEDGPMHITSTVLFIVRISLWMSLILSMCKVWNASFGVFTTVWISWNLCCNVHNSLTDMTVTSNVSPTKRQVVAQLGLMMNYSALFLGLVVASTIVLSVDEQNLSTDIVA